MRLSKKDQEAKDKFLDAAYRAKRTPGHVNKEKARKAYEKLPEQGKQELNDAGVKLDFLKDTKWLR